MVALFRRQLVLIMGLFTLLAIYPILYSLIPTSALIFITNSTNVVCCAKQLAAFIGFTENPIPSVEKQNITFTVGEANSSRVIPMATINGTLLNSSNIRQSIIQGKTAADGTFVYTAPKSKPGTYSVIVNVSATGYEPTSITRQFQVIVGKQHSK